MYQIILSLRTFENLETILKISGKNCCSGVVGVVGVVWGAGVCLFFPPLRLMFIGVFIVLQNRGHYTVYHILRRKKC